MNNILQMHNTIHIYIDIVTPECRNSEVRIDVHY
jgi:hypothetical protein